MHSIITKLIKLTLASTLVIATPTTQANQKKPQQSKKQTQPTQLTLEGLTPKQKAELLRTLRALVVRLERVQGQSESSNRRNSKVSLRLFASASAQDAPSAADIERQRQTSLRDLIGDDGGASKLNEIRELLSESISLRQFVPLFESATRDEKITRFRKRLGTELSIFLRDPGETPNGDPRLAAARNLNQLMSNYNNSNVQNMFQVPGASASSPPSASPANTSQTPATRLDGKTCNFAGMKSETGPNGRCKQPDDLICELPVGGGKGSKCGPLFTKLTNSPEPPDTCLPIAKNLSEQCGQKFPPLTELDISKMSDQQREAFNNELRTAIPSIEEQVYATCPGDGNRISTTSSQECQTIVQRYAQAVAVLRQNPDNRDVIDVRKDVMDRWVPYSFRTGLEEVGQNDKYTGFTPPSPTAVSPIAPAPFPVAAPAPPEAEYPDASPAQAEPPQDPTKCENTEPNKLASPLSQWSYRCVVNCDGQQILIVEKERRPKPDSEKNAVSDIFVFHGKPQELSEQVTTLENRRNKPGSRLSTSTIQQNFKSWLESKSLFGCTLDDSRKLVADKGRNKVVDNMRGLIRENLTCDKTKLFARHPKLPSVIAADNPRAGDPLMGRVRKLREKNSQFQDVVPNTKRSTTVTADQCTFTHTFGRTGANKDVVEWKVEDTNSAGWFGMRPGRGKDMMKCKASIGEDRDANNSFSRGAVALSVIASASFEGPNKQDRLCLNGTSETRTDTPVGAPSPGDSRRSPPSGDTQSAE